jgi:hypothetical protein
VSSAIVSTERILGARGLRCERGSRQSSPYSSRESMSSQAAA